MTAVSICHCPPLLIEPINSHRTLLALQRNEANFADQGEPVSPAEASKIAAARGDVADALAYKKDAVVDMANDAKNAIVQATKKAVGSDEAAHPPKK